MSEEPQVVSLSYQLAQKIIDALVEQNLLKESSVFPTLIDKIASGGMKPEDWKSELERTFASNHQPKG